jgi:hypothetical protein
MGKTKKKGEPKPCAGIPRAFHKAIQKSKGWEKKRDPSKPVDGYGQFMKKFIAPAWRALSVAERLKWAGKVCKDKGYTGKLSKTTQKGVKRTRIPIGHVGQTFVKNNCGPAEYNLMVKNKKKSAARGYIDDHCDEKALKRFDAQIKAKKKRAARGELKFTGGCGCALCRNKLGGCACSMGMGECASYLPSYSSQ